MPASVPDIPLQDFDNVGIIAAVAGDSFLYQSFTYFRNIIRFIQFKRRNLYFYLITESGFVGNIGGHQ